MLPFQSAYARLPQRARLGVLVGLSALLHLVLLAGLAWRVAGANVMPDPVEPMPIYLDIEPRPLLAGERQRPVRHPPEAPTDHTLRDPRARRDAPTPPAPRQVQIAPEAPPVVDEGLRAAPPSADADLAARIARSLQRGAGGCPQGRDGLTAAQRADCDQRFGTRAEGARTVQGTGDAQRDSRMAAEGARALQEYEGRRRPLSGGTGVVGPADCIGSNFGTGCAGAHLDPSMASDSRSNVRTRRDGPRVSGAPLTPGASGAASGRE